MLCHAGQRGIYLGFYLHLRCSCCVRRIQNAAFPETVSSQIAQISRYFPTFIFSFAVSTIVWFWSLAVKRGSQLFRDENTAWCQGDVKKKEKKSRSSFHIMAGRYPLFKRNATSLQTRRGQFDHRRRQMQVIRRGYDKASGRTVQKRGN